MDCDLGPYFWNTPETNPYPCNNPDPCAHLFRDESTTALCSPGAQFRPAAPADAPELEGLELDKDGGWVLELDGSIAAAGGILLHYNPPYGDLYMKVAERFRRRGQGAYLVQQLKQVCYQRGNVPAARCRTDNIASRKTLQRAGFVACAHLLAGSVGAGATATASPCAEKRPHTPPGTR